MFGCHNCSHRPQKDENYEDSPCAHCRTAMDPALLSGYGGDPAGYGELKTMHPDCGEDFPDELLENHYCREDLAEAVSQTAKTILRLKTRCHSACRILEMKIDRPELSYSQLAEILSCRKQNIQYHLHKILNDCPELGFLLPAARKKNRRTGGNQSDWKRITGRKQRRPPRPRRI